MSRAEQHWTRDSRAPVRFVFVPLAHTVDVAFKRDLAVRRFRLELVNDLSAEIAQVGGLVSIGIPSPSRSRARSRRSATMC